MYGFSSPIIGFQQSLIKLRRWHQKNEMLWFKKSTLLRLIGFGGLAACFLLQGCAEKASTQISQKDLQHMVNQSFLSPQIRTLDLIPGVGVQLYLETPEVLIVEGQSALLFKFNGQIGADLFGSTLTERLPLSIEGTADLIYNEGEHAFYFQKVDLREARLDMQIALFETLVLDKLKQALTQEISHIAIISLNDTSMLLREINGRKVSTSIVDGMLQLSYTAKS